MSLRMAWARGLKQDFQNKMYKVLEGCFSRIDRFRSCTVKASDRPFSKTLEPVHHRLEHARGRRTTELAPELLL